MPTTDARIDDLIEQWHEGAAAGAPPRLEVLCRDCPELISEVHRRLAREQQLLVLSGQPEPAATVLSDGPTSQAQPRRPAPLLPVAMSAGLAPPHGPDELGWLGPYRIRSVLGEGGMGLVFRAEEPLPADAWRSVAIKILHPKVLHRKLARCRFELEGLVLARLQSDRVVPLLHIGRHEDTLYLVMPLLKGETLKARLDRCGRLPPPLALRVARYVCEGLQAAHESHIIHRDVKPANIWLKAGSDAALVMDFGLARVLDRVTELTPAGQGVGSVHYSAPEQARGEQPDERADLFGLGVVLYEMLLGRLPFPGQTIDEVILAVESRPATPPAVLDPSLPAGLSDLVVRLLSRDRESRPVSAAEVVAALARVERSLPPAQP